MSREIKELYKDAKRVLKQTSRTFYIPISLLKSPLKRTVASAYLCMRAIDEIEDHEELPTEVKISLLTKTSDLLLNNFDKDQYQQLIHPYMDVLPEVTIRLADWLLVCPEGIIDKVKESTAEMASGMAKWVEKDFQIITEKDLDEYTYYVAGLVGVMLSDIWHWYDGTETSRELAIGFGRGLQAVNILRNQDEDIEERGVSFMPDTWSRDDMFQYATKNLHYAEQYIESLKTRNIIIFCNIPYKLAHKTLSVMKSGQEKMTRDEVNEIVDEATK